VRSGEKYNGKEAAKYVERRIGSTDDRSAVNSAPQHGRNEILKEFLYSG
jgi:hypothetical protein